MTYQQFQQEIIHRVRQSITEEVTLSLQSIPKNNQIQLDGLTITPKDCNISPTIYLNSFYEAYRHGSSLASITAEISRIYQENRPSESINTSFYTDFSQVKDRLMVKLIHYSRNQSLLKDIPHFRCMDLAIVFYCLISVTPAGSATILVRNSHLALWNMTKAALLPLALQNSVSRLEPSFSPLSELMDEPEEEPSALHTELHILTNRHKLFGAACVLYPGLLESISDSLHSDLILLPSSIHEILLLPEPGSPGQEALNEMVRDVNLTQVSPEEILSDHIYYYSRQDNSLHYDRESYSCS